MNKFAKSIKSDVRLGAGAQLRLNFELPLATGASSIVEVDVASENLILEKGSSIGVVLPEEKTKQLPLVNSNVLDLVKVMGGVVMTENPIFGADQTTLAGLSANNVNVQKDGVTANDVRWATGMNTPVNLNPELDRRIQSDPTRLSMLKWRAPRGNDCQRSRRQVVRDSATARPIQYRSLRPHPRQSIPGCRAKSALHFLDRCGHRILLEYAPVPGRRLASSQGFRSHRRAGELFRLRLQRSQGRQTFRRQFRAHRSAVETGAPAAAHRSEGAGNRSPGAALQQPGFPARYIRLDGRAE